MKPAPGATLGDTYLLDALIGQGGMGSVWSASHMRVPRKVAIKVLQDVADPNSQAFARFRREAEIAGQLNHPNVVDVHDFNVDDGAAYLVMELLSGESLAQRLRSGPLPLDGALTIAAQVAAGLAAAHAAGIVHRDLKPANVFLCAPNDQVKVLDFGISKVLASQTIQTGADVLVGTPQYMAPEQAQPDGDAVGPYTDQFALGVLVYELLAGRSPFGTGPVAAVVYRVVNEAPASLAELCPNVPDNVIAAVNRALSKRPADRFDSLADFVHALGAPAVESAQTQPAQAAPAVGRSQLIIMLGAGFAVGIAALVLSMAGTEQGGDATPVKSRAPQTQSSAVTPAPQPTAALNLEAPTPRAAEGSASRERAATAPLAAPVAKKRGVRPDDSRLLSKEATALRKQARVALAGGDFSRAAHLGGRMARAGAVAEGAVIVAKAHCARKDVGRTRAALARVPRRLRASVIRYCKARGVDLQ